MASQADRATVHYSQAWRATFGRVDPAATAHETSFLARVLPLPAFRSLLDVACGSGRHADGLAAHGYDVVGIDSDEAVVQQARGSGLDVRVGDVRDLGSLPLFDAVLCLWASFGWFEPATNEAVLAGLAARLRPGGRLIVDVYHPGFFRRHDGERWNRGVLERTAVRSGRLYTDLRHPDGTSDRFSWQLFEPQALAELAGGHGLRRVLACAGFDEAVEPSAARARYQLVLARRSPRR